MKSEFLGDLGYNKSTQPVTGLFIENRIPCEWLSTKEAAIYLRISANALRICVYRGQIKVHKFGKRNRFNVEELRELLSLKGA